MSAWQPTASIENLKKRAKIIKQIRHFFASRGVLEVETPLLSAATVTDPFIHSFTTHFIPEGGAIEKKLYLQTSPEFAMKRLLASGSGPIFQICKAFRNGERGKKHNPEFTMLEWYQPGYDHHQLMNEVAQLLQVVLEINDAKYLSYKECFEKIDINPHTDSIEKIQAIAISYGLEAIANIISDKDTWLQRLMSDVIEPSFKDISLVFVYDYPETQAALAKICHGEHLLAERFEAYVHGIELANGYHELTDAEEQALRFNRDLSKRKQKVNLDRNLIAALEHGMPSCAGVALGVDRLMMLAANSDNIADVVAFTSDNA